MSKRLRSPSPGPVAGGVAGVATSKKQRTVEAQDAYKKIATAEAAAAVDANPPYAILLRELENTISAPRNGEAVVFWMRMEDMRVVDNRALSQASLQARKERLPIVVLFVLSPQDYKAHDRAARRIDFTLRNLRLLKKSLNELNIPLYTITHTPRRTLPERIIDFAQSINAKHLFANMEYEVDELRRDIKVCQLSREAGIHVDFVHDKLLVNPGTLSTQQGKPYTVYSPFQKSWLKALHSNPEMLYEAPAPELNDITIRDSPILNPLFDCAIPDEVRGFECEDKETMSLVWPAGYEAAKEVLHRFLHTKSRAAQLGVVNPLADGAEKSTKHSRIMDYADGRDRADRDTSSRLSPYLAAGVISARECARQTMLLSGSDKVQATRDSGVGMWCLELAWRDFYTHVLVAFPRVSMGRPFQEKFADVKWEVNDDHLQAWKDGKTGIPIVDAGMRQCKQMGWVHNRVRMIAAMYLTKDLMLDWRLGEKHFMSNLIDGDLASNNGGWQWSASTGTDAQPYFRIFNPYSQSLKADPTGDYIRTFVPELAALRGPDIHNPPPATAVKLGYPRPLVDHAEARKRALRRYKDPGTE